MDLEKVLDYARNRAGYVEVRMERVTENRISIEDGQVKGLVRGVDGGYAVRVLVDGAWGFAAANDPSVRVWKDTVDKAVGLAKAASGFRAKPVKLAAAPSRKQRVDWKPKKNPDTVDTDTRLELLRAMEAKLRTFPQIQSVSTGQSDATIEKRYMDSEGRDVKWSMVRSLAQAHFTARDGAQLASGSTRIGGTRGWELFDLHDPVAQAESDAKVTVAQLRAKAAKGGKRTVVIDHELAGVFAHEAVGHASEADLISAGESCFKGRMGEKLGIDGLSICDDSLVPGAFGSFPFDDTGVAGQRRPILENGVLVGYLADREHGHALGHKATGSARAQDYASRPLVRMSNTLIEPGNHTTEEVFEGIKDGVYCVGSRGGQVDTARGTFLFNAREAYAIRNGEIAEPLKDVSLTGAILSTLHGIDALGDEAKLGNPGHCGKGQWVPVCDGGPLVRIRDCLVGGGA